MAGKTRGPRLRPRFLSLRIHYPVSGATMVVKGRFIGARETARNTGLESVLVEAREATRLFEQDIPAGGMLVVDPRCTITDQFSGEVIYDPRQQPERMARWVQDWLRRNDGQTQAETQAEAASDPKPARAAGSGASA